MGKPAILVPEFNHLLEEKLAGCDEPVYQLVEIQNTMGVSRGRSQQTRSPRITKAAIKESIVKPPSLAALTEGTLGEQIPVGTDEPVIAKGHNHGYVVSVQSTKNGWRDLVVNVVEMRDVGLCRTDQPI